MKISFFYEQFGLRSKFQFLAKKLGIRPKFRFAANLSTLHQNFCDNEIQFLMKISMGQKNSDFDQKFSFWWQFQWAKKFRFRPKFQFKKIDYPQKSRFIKISVFNDSLEQRFQFFIKISVLGENFGFRSILVNKNLVNI